MGHPYVTSHRYGSITGKEYVERPAPRRRDARMREHMRFGHMMLAVVISGSAAFIAGWLLTYATPAGGYVVWASLAVTLAAAVAFILKSAIWWGR